MARFLSLLFLLSTTLPCCDLFGRTGIDPRMTGTLVVGGTGRRYAEVVKQNFQEK